MRATSNLRTNLSGNATWRDQVELNQNSQGLVMARSREILFVDPSVSDIDTILGGLRPEVEAIVLDVAQPAAQQIAAALAGRRGLAAVHVIAHGAPGRVNFTSGDWSVVTLEDEAENLAAIGHALADDGELRLWSCDTAASEPGTAFIKALAQATGADVAASTGRVGAGALGGTWDLTADARRASARPPLTAAAMAAYAGVLTTYTWTGGGTTTSPGSSTWSLSTNWSPSGPPNSTGTALLGGSSTYTVTLDASESIAALNITNSSATLTFASGNNLTLSGALTNRRYDFDCERHHAERGGRADQQFRYLERHHHRRHADRDRQHCGQQHRHHHAGRRDAERLRHGRDQQLGYDHQQRHQHADRRQRRHHQHEHVQRDRRHADGEQRSD